MKKIFTVLACMLLGASTLALADDQGAQDQAAPAATTHAEKMKMKKHKHHRKHGMKKHHQNEMHKMQNKTESSEPTPAS